MNTIDPDERRTSGSGGLTTEDIADPGRGSGTGATDTAPIYPGEATARDAREREEYADASTGRKTEAAGVDAADEEGAAPLLGGDEGQEFRRRWSEIQGRFVDDPRESVRSADALVAEVMQSLASTFAQDKQGLEGQWDRGEEVPTEDLRLALRQYRTFFERLLHA
ncbi:hypothetical protein [Streptomyces sp. NPDC048606]|uniref:hypothetical protein n=1 Tax=Streptomyces sp. NPDC048606 TaxID=3154726 RepID=UPI003418DFAA